MFSIFGIAVAQAQTTDTSLGSSSILSQINFTLIGLIISLSLFVFGILVVIVLILRRTNRLPRSLNTTTFLVTLPKEKKESQEEPQKEEKDIISVAEQMFSNLYALEPLNKGPARLFLGKDHITFEIVSIEKEIRFYVTSPNRFAGFVEKQIHSQYPKAQIDKSGEYSFFKSNYVARGTRLKIVKDNYYPFKTYKNLEADPLNALTNSLSKLEKDEGAAIQVIIRPAKKNWTKSGTAKAHTMQQGKSKKSKGILGGAQEVGNLLKTKKDQEPERPDEVDRLTPMQEETIKAIEEKTSKLGFDTIIRVVTSAKTDSKADLLLKNIVGSFTQYNSPTLNRFIQTAERKSKVIENYIFRYFPVRKKFILNTEELASIFHFPSKYSDTPNIKWLMSKKAPPPLNVPKKGVYIGDNVYRGVKTKIKIAKEDRMRHLYVIGKTGGGKSTLLENLIVQDIKNGDGVCVVDPHGDLVENVLLGIPKERADDVVIFAPGDYDRPVGLNMLEFYKDEQKDFVVQEMIAIFYKLFPPEMIGPMFEHNMRNVMLTLMADKENPGTIIEIPRMFTDDKFQKYKVDKVTDPVVRAFWEQEMANTSDFHKSEMLGYLISKVGRFVENEMMRNIIGQTESGFNVREIMDNKKILLVNLSKGKVGEVNSDLLGLIIVSKIQMAAMARADMASSDRKDFFLYIDEFQNYTTDSIATILSEARKYRLSLNIAHQYISQLVKDNDTKIKDAVFGNVGSMMSYRVGAEDAEALVKEFSPTFDEYDLTNVEKFSVLAKIVIDNAPTKPFNIAIPPPESMTGGNKEVAEAIKQLSRLKYGRDRQIVQAELDERMKISSSGPKDQSIGMEKTA